MAAEREKNDSIKSLSLAFKQGWLRCFYGLGVSFWFPKKSPRKRLKGQTSYTTSGYNTLTAVQLLLLLVLSAQKSGHERQCEILGHAHNATKATGEDC